MRLGQPLNPRDRFIDPRVVLHRARPQRIHPQINRIVPRRKPREVPNDLNLTKLRHRAQVISAHRIAQQGSSIHRRHIQLRQPIPLLPSRRLLKNQILVLIHMRSSLARCPNKLICHLNLSQSRNKLSGLSSFAARAGSAVARAFLLSSRRDLLLSLSLPLPLLFFLSSPLGICFCFSGCHPVGICFLLVRPLMRARLILPFRLLANLNPIFFTNILINFSRDVGCIQCIPAAFLRA